MLSAFLLYAVLCAPVYLLLDFVDARCQASEAVQATAAVPVASARTDDQLDQAKIDAYLAAPMLQLADSLQQNNFNDAAQACRDWVPVRRPDALTAFFSSVSPKGPVAIEKDPLIAAAFLKARQETAERALRGAFHSAENNRGAMALELLWRAVREQPGNQQARKLLGLPQGNTARATTTPGRTAPAVLAWPPRSFLVGQSQHFRIYSTAPKREVLQLAEDLERYFEVWSQVFFQQWTSETDICKQLSAKLPILMPKVVCEVVLFGDRSAYIRTLGSENPASSQSTGYYSPEHKLTLLFTGVGADVETRYHEVTHQLLQEAVANVVDSPGLKSGFWIVEGIASYMESIQFGPAYATIGGWHSPRLQYSRARILPTEQAPTLESFLPLGRDQFQNDEDLAALYSTAAAYVHMLSETPATRQAMLRYLKAVYQARDADELLTSEFAEIPSNTSLVDFLKLSSWKSQPLPQPLNPLDVLCLNRAEISAEQLSNLAPQAQLSWLDLGWLNVNSQQVMRLAGNGTGLRRINLEATKVDDEISGLLTQQRQLEELDLSFTQITDQTIYSLRTLDRIQTLWLTGAKIGTPALASIKSLRELNNLDVQRTSITEQDLEALRQAKPSLKLNPLILQ